MAEDEAGMGDSWEVQPKYQGMAPVRTRIAYGGLTGVAWSSGSAHHGLPKV